MATAATATPKQNKQNKKGKKKSSTPSENFLLMPTPPSTLPIVDTHTHLLATFSNYQMRYNKPDSPAKFQTIYDFVKGMYAGRSVEALVDVWCEPALFRQYKELADSALTPEGRATLWGGTEYWFAMGVHPHQARHYNDDIEAQILEAMKHPRCVSWGEVGLDYHYSLSPPDVQREVLARQLRQAVRLGKPITIHTREAEEDTERILKEVVPRDHRIHVHCFTDSPEFAARLLDHFPNLYIGITGVITYATNANTSQVVRNLLPSNMRVLLETDAPYMVPANLYGALKDPGMRGKKLPICHTAMIPWVAEFVATVANGSGAPTSTSVEEIACLSTGPPEPGVTNGNAVASLPSVARDEWTVDRVMREARDNARRMYGV